MPTYAQFLTGAILGSCAGVWVRVVGTLALNHSLSWANLQYFLFSSSAVPQLAVQAFATFLIIGTPVFLVARKRNKINLSLFVVEATVFGYLASAPLLLIPSWAFIYASTGFVSGLVAFAVMWALTFRSRSLRPSASAGLPASGQPLT